jgi:hypothetical protein
MAREVITWCDRCLHSNGGHIPASERRVGIGIQWWSADLCDDCSSELLDPLAKLVANAGRHYSDTLTRQLGSKASVMTAASRTLQAPDIVPSDRDNELFLSNLARRKRGERRGIRPDAELESPCIFCGISMRMGGNTAHLKLHGFSTASRALGSSCPWCERDVTSLGAHFARTHQDQVTTSPLNVSLELLRAHIAGAPYDRVAAIRARAYNVEPLDDVLRGLVDA